MPFILEDGTTVAGANAYITAAFYREYHTDRGRDVAAETDEQIEGRIIQASQYQDERFGDRLKGNKAEETHTLEFPREGIYLADGTEVEGVPLKWAQATAEYALEASNGSLFSSQTIDASGRAVTGSSLRLGPLAISDSFEEGGVTPFRSFPLADRLVSDFLRYSGSRSIRA